MTRTNLPKESEHRMSKTYWLSVTTLVGIFVVNTLGFADTVTGSAMGCGRDWPLCNGQVVPSYWNSAVIIEYTHRISVVVGGLLLLALSFAAWRKYGYLKVVRFLVLLSLAGVVLEGALGALAVLFVNPPAVMAAHMGIALFSLIGVGLITYVIRQSDLHSAAALEREPLDVLQLRRFGRPVWFSIAYGYLAIYVGAYVASTGYGGAFQGWPFPTESYAVVGAAFWVDILHRSVALGYLLLMLLLVRRSLRLKSVRPQFFRMSCTALLLVSLQAVSGGILIATHLSVYAFLAHVTIVSLLFLTQCFLGLQVILERRYQIEADKKWSDKRALRQKAGA